MKQWNFYYSGVLYGIIRDMQDSGKTLFHRPLDPFTGNLQEETAFLDDSFYAGLCSRGLLHFFKGLVELEGHIQNAEASFTTHNGDSYTRRKECGEEGISYIQRGIKFPMDVYFENDQIYAVLMSGRDYAAVLVLDGMEDRTILKEWKTTRPGTAPMDTVKRNGNGICPVTFDGTYMVPTKDGELLATDVYLPAGVMLKGKMENPSGGEAACRIPAVLIRTPYGKSNGSQQYFRFVQRGYAVVIQDVRGREDSTGEWLPCHYEIEDGNDALDWIAARPWSDGQAAMTGGSYLGYVQWAAAASGNPHLKAILSSVCAGSPFTDFPRRGGSFSSGTMAWNFAMSEQRFRKDLMLRDDWDEVLEIRPLKDMAKKTLGVGVPFLEEWLRHPHYDDFWKKGDWKERSRGFVVPALVTSGWFDDNGMGTTEALELIDDFYPRGTFKIVLGPWKHSGNADYDIHGIFMGERALRYDMDILAFQWLEHFLKGVDNGIETSAPVEYYTLGSDRWNSGTLWPLEETEVIPWYLGRETLTLRKPTNETGDAFTYDPAFPATHLIDVSENELEVPEDYANEEKREDVLCYTTVPFTKEYTVTGDITAVLYLSSDCPDTDLFVRITDVDQYGHSIKLADGVLDVRYRNGFEKPEFMEPGGIYQVIIRTTKLSNTFLPGHCMRFTVTSGAKNFMFPNTNTKDSFDGQEKRIAHNTIRRGGKCASRLIVPVQIS